MYNEISRYSISDRFFYMTVLVFYSLNTRHLQLPSSDIIRWAVLLMLMIITIAQGNTIFFPPFLLAYIFAIVPSLFVSIDIRTSIIKATSFLFTIVAVSTYFMSLKSRNKMDQSLRFVLKAIMIFGVANIVGMVGGSAFDGERAVGISSNANSLGLYANMCLIACVYYKDRFIKRKRMVINVIMLLSLFLVVLSGSRSCFAALMLNLVIIFVGENKTNRMIIFCASILAVIIIVNNDSLHIRALEQLLTPEGRTRGLLWETGISVWKAHPFFGCGYMTSEQLNTSDLSVGRYAFHNSYISILAEIGIWGVSIIGLYVMKKIISFVHQIKIEQFRERFSPYYLAILIMINMLITAYGESFLFAIGSAEAFIFWTLFMWSSIYLYKGRFEE